ncbi:MAG: tRNA guanosine(34) transglycosylase Tgt [Bdellovibrionales bacterium]|nr:tRNA guanosine(34) transglycosylase Tgt [Bdellovibrionales bacterium]
MSFVETAVDGTARCSTFKTSRGELHLPLFCPVATLGSVKSLDPLDLEELDVQMILANAYHLHLRPGDSLVKQQGGLHSFMNWQKPILTDSGGYQVFSLSQMNKITDEGVLFRNHLDGDEVFMTPELSIQIQLNLGADIIMVFDHCPLGQISKKECESAVERTFLWLKKSYQEFVKSSQPSMLFGIVQGGVYEDLRLRSLEQVESLDLPGIAVGGMSVGEDKEKMYDIVQFIGEKLPKNKPRYLMGVGTPKDLIHAVDSGFDLFDCVLPTRLARSGSVWTFQGLMNIRNHQYREDSKPLDENCVCRVCQKYSRSYLRHLFMSRELLSYRLLTFHNVHFYMELMKQIRASIKNKSWSSFRNQMLKAFS